MRNLEGIRNKLSAIRYLRSIEFAGNFKKKLCISSKVEINQREESFMERFNVCIIF